MNARGLLRTALLVGAAVAATLVSLAASAAPTPPPNVSAPAWILVEQRTGAVLAEHNADQQRPPASVTKIMTGMVVFDAIAAGELTLDDKVKVSARAWRAGKSGTRTFVRQGSYVKVVDLIRGMVIQSGNDSAVALAEKVAGSEAAFAQRMNKTSRALGMRNSYWTNASGLDAVPHVTSARDLATLSRHLIAEHPDAYRYFSGREFEWAGVNQKNRNPLLQVDPTADGIKTGWTVKAGYCMVGSARRGAMRLIVVLLGEPNASSRARDARALLDWGFAEFDLKRAYAAGQEVGTARVWKGTEPEVGLATKSEVWTLVPRGQSGPLAGFVQLARPLMAPLIAQTEVGMVRVQLADQPLVEAPVVVTRSVELGSPFQRIVEGISLGKDPQ
jgi:D-alanyl-D-alanine carboxypeptidase (penicillin-binding protein 5/6)